MSRPRWLEFELALRWRAPGQAQRRKVREPRFLIQMQTPACARSAWPLRSPGNRGSRSVFDLVLLGYVRATLQDNPSRTADETRMIVTGGEGQTLEFKETTAQMPRAVKTLPASVIMHRA